MRATNNPVSSLSFSLEMKLLFFLFSFFFLFTLITTLLSKYCYHNCATSNLVAVHFVSFNYPEYSLQVLTIQLYLLFLGFFGHLLLRSLQFIILRFSTSTHWQGLLWHPAPSLSPSSRTPSPARFVSPFMLEVGEVLGADIWNQAGTL